MLPKRTRLKAFDYLGPCRYFLTFCTHLRQPLFTCAETVGQTRAQILRAARQHDFEVHAYVFMRDHVHLLVEGTSDDSDLRAFARLAKQYSGHAHARTRKQRLWQPSYFERVLREDEDTSQVVAYIMNNPVHAGYVTDWGEYRFMGSATLSMEEMGDVVRANPHPPWEP